MRRRIRVRGNQREKIELEKLARALLRAARELTEEKNDATTAAVVTTEKRHDA
jgi:hypothetical protein